MKAEKLMIGDWANLNLYPFTCKPVAQQITLNILGKLSTLTGIKAEPMPLTQEIMEANGWKRIKAEVNHQDYWYKHSQVNFYVHITDKEYNHGFESEEQNDDAYLVFSCNAVHKLQQALRLNELSELAENFKVG